MILKLHMRKKIIEVVVPAANKRFGGKGLTDGTDSIILQNTGIN